MLFTSGNEITYHCKYGLALEGSNTLICSLGEGNSADGVWIGREPMCVNADLRPFEGNTSMYLAQAKICIYNGHPDLLNKN